MPEWWILISRIPDKACKFANTGIGFTSFWPTLSNSATAITVRTILVYRSIFISLSPLTSILRDTNRQRIWESFMGLIAEQKVLKFEIIAVNKFPFSKIPLHLFDFSRSKRTTDRTLWKSIHSFCGKSCGKKRCHHRNSLLNNDKDQIAHKMAYAYKL